MKNVHGVVVLRHGRIVFERYMSGTDAAWGRPLGQVSFQADTLHDLRSVTKSIVGLLYGIALAGGHVPALDQPLLAQFPEYPDLANDPARAPIKVVHALTMTLGNGMGILPTATLSTVRSRWSRRPTAMLHS